EAMGVGVSLLTVTLGPRGAAYVAAPGFDGLTGGRSDPSTARPSDRPTVRTALIPAPQVDALDPTGCGDVFGAAVFARLLAGDSVEPALRHATNLAARNAAFRGASGLSRYLRGELVTL
ncbi:MAG TPA: PfkB family carbohydrate kinase, partial [Gemmatimonadales bacterium]|nr:PfkB family carbohydrate kinase [Gemmatimonadales bacterium]